MLNKIIISLITIGMVGCGNSQPVSPEMKEQAEANRQHQKEQQEAEQQARKEKYHAERNKRNMDWELRQIKDYDFKVVKLFDHDGCTVYGYEDHHGHYDHFFRCDEKKLQNN